MRVIETLQDLVMPGDTIGAMSSAQGSVSNSALTQDRLILVFGNTLETILR